MNTLTLVSLLAVAAVPSLTTTAGEPLLSPRAKANATMAVPGVTEEKLDRGNLYRHRGDFAFEKPVAGVSTVKETCCTVAAATASPRAMATFPNLAGGPANCGR